MADAPPYLPCYVHLLNQEKPPYSSSTLRLQPHNRPAPPRKALDLYQVAGIKKRPNEPLQPIFQQSHQFAKMREEGGDGSLTFQWVPGFSSSPVGITSTPRKECHVSLDGDISNRPYAPNMSPPLYKPYKKPRCQANQVTSGN